MEDKTIVVEPQQAEEDAFNASIAVAGKELQEKLIPRWCECKKERMTKIANSWKDAKPIDHLCQFFYLQPTHENFVKCYKHLDAIDKVAGTIFYVAALEKWGEDWGVAMTMRLKFSWYLMQWGIWFEVRGDSPKGYDYAIMAFSATGNKEFLDWVKARNTVMGNWAVKSVKDQDKLMKMNIVFPANTSIPKTDEEVEEEDVNKEV